MSPTFSTLRSIHSASAACMRARRARGIPAYAASRVSACLIACSRSSGKREPLRRRMKSRSSSSAKSASPPISSRTGASQNTRPITDAACSAAFSRAGSRSMRAASTPRTESGIESCCGSAATSHRSSRCARTPLSTSDSISSSTKNGLPSERCTSRSRTCSGRSATSSAATSSASGSSSIAVTCLRPPPHSSSGLAVATTSSGPRTSRIVRSSSSSSGASAQWTSSTSRTSGPRAQSSFRSSTQASRKRSRAASGCRSPATSRPNARPRIGRSFERAGLLLKDLPDGPVRPRRPVRKAPADAERGVLRASLEPRPQLAQEAALAHAGLAEDDRELRLPAVDRALVCVAKSFELVTASDERPLVGAAGPDRRQCPDEQPAGDGLALPLRVDVLQLAELERTPGRLRGPLAHDDLAGVRSLLEARAHVHGVPGDERAVRVGVDDHLAGVHADPQRERRVELGETLAHRERGMERTLGVVLQRRGSAERRHDGVAGELLDGATDPLDLLGHRREEPVEQHPHRLGVGLADGGRPDEIGEEHGRDLPLHERIVAQLAGSDLVDPNRAVVAAVRDPEDELRRVEVVRQLERRLRPGLL